MDRLLVDASVLGPTTEKGAQRYARELVEELANQSELDLRVLVRKGANAFSERSSGKVVEIDIRGRTLWLMRDLNRYANSYRFTTVLVAGEGPALVDFPTRLFIAAHEVPHHLLASRRKFGTVVRHLPTDKLTGHALRSSTGVFALSSFMAGCLTGHYRLKPDVVTVVPPGLPPSFLDGAINKENENEEKFALVFSTGDAREDPAVAIRALELAQTSIRRLILVGSSSDSFRRHHLKHVPADARSLKVQSVGRVDDLTLRGLYASAECYIETSCYEGYGLQVAEALSQGCPVFLRRTPVFHEFGLGTVHYWDGSAESLAARLNCFEKSQSRVPKKRVILHTWSDAASEIRKTVFAAP